MVSRIEGMVVHFQRSKAEIERDNMEDQRSLIQAIEKEKKTLLNPRKNHYYSPGKFTDLFLLKTIYSCCE